MNDAPQNDYQLHDQVGLLLPWYVNGTLEMHERLQVERHLSVCLPCRARLRDERALLDNIRASDEDDTAVQVGFAELLASIGEQPASAAAPASARPRGGRPRAGFVLSALSVAAAIVLVVGAVSHLGPVSATFAPGPQPYRVLAQAADAPPSARPAVRVVYDEEVTAARIAAIEAASGLVATASSRTGRVRTLQVTGIEGDTREHLAHALRVLAAAPEVVFATPIGTDDVPGQRP
ncbi:MAG: zf-HC2 domain-containing protein [Gammaproteobacteria bacterium]